MDMSFKKVSVIGAGTLGAQIAMLAAYAGYQVFAKRARVHN